MVVITAGNPLLVVAIRHMSTAVDHPAGCQPGIDSMQEEIKAESRISGNGIDVEVRVSLWELQQKCGGRQVFMQIGRTEVIQQGQAEAAAEIRQAQGQAAVAVARLAMLCASAGSGALAALGLSSAWLEPV